MRPPGYQGPKFISDITNPVTLIAFLIVLILGGWITFRCWFTY